MSSSPLPASPTSPHLGDPARWLVLFNVNDPDSAAFAEAYRTRRGVPSDRLLGLDLPSHETLSPTQCDAVLASVDAFVNGQPWGDLIGGIVLGYGVPSLVDLGAPGPIESVAARLQSTARPPTWHLNPLASDAIPTRPDASAWGGLRATASLDAPTLADALALLDRAEAIAAAGPLDPATSVLWFDPYFASGGGAETPTAQLESWGQSIDRQRLRLPIRWSRDPDLAATDFAAFASVDRDAVYFGWSQAQPPVGFFGEPGGTRACCVQFNVTQPTAGSLRDADASHWIAAAHRAGYAAAIASTRATSFGHVPFARPFFEALRQGWTLAEAWMLAAPILGEGFFLAGDPLLTVATPQAGWDVFGPIDTLDDLAGPPTERLPADARSWSPVEAIEPGAEGRFVVARVDEASPGVLNTHTGVWRADASGGVMPAIAWLWPHATGWRPRAVDAALECVAMWHTSEPLPPGTVLELLATEEGEQAGTVVWSSPLDARREATAGITPPTQPTRYRWRLVMGQQERAVSPRSARVTPAAAPPATLTLLEDAR